jgi:hypothetical protein
MNGPVGPLGPRHAHAGKHGATHRRKSAASDDKGTDVPAGKLFTFTLNGDTARVVKLELIDASGAHRELSEDEKAQMLGENRESALEALLTRAFEAGIQIALEDTFATLEEPDEADEPEASEEDALRRLLLKRLIERSSMKGLLDRDVLTRAILETLIQQSTNEPAATNGPSPGATADRTTHTRNDRH